MNLILFDDDRRSQLLPFTHTRPTADIRCGILTMRERWERLLQCNSSTLTETYLQPVFPLHCATENCYVNGSVFVQVDLKNAIQSLGPEQALFHDGQLLALNSKKPITSFLELKQQAEVAEKLLFQGPILKLNQVWDIFALNEQAIVLDFKSMTAGRQSNAIPAYVTAICPENIFIEEGAVLNPCILNAGSGYIYIGKDAEVMDGAMVRGHFSLGEHAVLKMGAKVYGATTIGFGCKVGGEVSNVVFFNNSNKGHDGFLGNAVIGDWCNLGADTNCSNLKNNYDEIKIWGESENKLVKTGLQFCGLLMGDHSKCGINTMFNTGTVVGISCNVYGSDFPEKFIPSFSWGGKGNRMEYDLNTAQGINKTCTYRNEIINFITYRRLNINAY